MVSVCTGLLGKEGRVNISVYSILPQSTQQQNGYLALIRQCLELVWEYLSGIEMVSVYTSLLGEEGLASASVDTRLLTEYLYLYL